ncbi:TPA: MFS transporter [Serratia fonticola]
MVRSKIISDSDIPVIGAEHSLSRRLLSFSAILSVYFFYDLNWMIDGLIRNSLINKVGFSMTEVSFIFGALELGTVPGTVIFGMIASRTSKKRSLMLLAICMGFFTLLPLIDPDSFYVWIISRFICGLTLGGFFGTSISLIVDLFPSKYRAIFASILYSSFAIGIQISGMIYSLLGDEGWKLLIIICAFGPVLGCFFVYFLVPDDYEHMKIARELDKTQSVTGDRIWAKNIYLSMYRDHKKLGLSLLMMSSCNFLAYAFFNSNALYYMKEVMAMPAGTAGNIFTASGIGLFVGYYFWGVMASLVGRKFGMFGFLIAGIGMVLYLQLNAASSIVTFYLCSLSVGFGFGCTSYWGVYYTELFPEKYRPIAAGISFNGGRLVTSVAIPTITSFSAGSVPYVISWGIGAVMIGFIIWFFLPETIRD